MGIKANKINLDTKFSIHHIFSWPFFAMQIFGLMPLQGLFSKKLSDISFSWMSLRTLYALITTAGLFFMTATQIARFFIFQGQIVDVQRLWYFAKSWFISIFFINMAREWQDFLKKWYKLDTTIARFGNPVYVKGKAVGLLVFFMFLFIGDYVLIQLQRIQEDLEHGNLVLNLELWNYFQEKKRFKYVYDLFPYDFFSGLCLLFIQLQVLFAGTFLDLFIMIISICLASRMKLITKKIQNVSSCKDVPENVWRNLRDAYNRIETLCKYINSKVGYAVLICFIGNLGLIIIQLYNNLQDKRSAIQKSYLYYAFFFLLSKTLAVCIFGSKINDESQKPLTYLYSAEDCAYNVEIDRLIRQISRNNIALSGMNFFQLRRNLVLKIAGSIVTYELVFIQFATEFFADRHIQNKTSSL